jgi:hypothetical protein
MTKCWPEVESHAGALANGFCFGAVRLPGSDAHAKPVDVGCLPYQSADRQRLVVVERLSMAPGHAGMMVGGDRR